MVAVAAGLVLAAGTLVAVSVAGGSPSDEAPATAREAAAPPGSRSPAPGDSAGSSGGNAPGSAREGRSSTSPSASSSASAPSSAASPSSSASADASGGAGEGPSSTPGDTASLPAPPPGAPSASAPPQSSQPAPPGLAADPAVLRRGDEGPEVEELQRRLQLVHLYPGKPNGRFDSRLEQTLTAYQWTRGATDERGVYGPDTRTKLEGETSQLQ
ncbi:peptidoglycan-binding domain-containing protein [Streptomyces sp. NPDC049954]|uniref:peptidoglycan-binding domain-containing protein n=1 Tax=Streptomyces sp. NPDC049954 TaxID=3155779 RepID=UPI00341AD389